MKRAALPLIVLALSGVLSAQQATPPQQQSEQRGRGPRDPRTAGGGNCSANPYNCIDTPNPLKTPDTVWLEEMTWMDVRDALKAGKTTVIIPTGGMEPNGPWLALGKHNYILRVNCDAIARKLGNALCAPIIPLVPEGGIDPKSGHMATVGTISLREETFQAMLADVVHSFKMHGFENIVLIGDSGGNTKGMQAVADKWNAEWKGAPLVIHAREYLRLRVRVEVPGRTRRDQGRPAERRPPRRSRDHAQHAHSRPEQRPLGAAREGEQGDDRRRFDR